MSTPRKVKTSAILASALAASAVGMVQSSSAEADTAGARPGTATANVIATWQNRKTAGYYMTVHNGGTANGTNIDTTNENTKPQQHWAMDSQGVFYDGYLQYQAVNVNSAKCLNLRTGNGITGRQLDQWTCPNGNSDDFGEVSVRSTDHGTQGNLLGWVLWAGGPGAIINQGADVCENPTTHSVYSVSAFGVFSGAPSKQLRCIWH